MNFPAKTRTTNNNENNNHPEYDDEVTSLIVNVHDNNKDSLKQQRRQQHQQHCCTFFFFVFLTFILLMVIGKALFIWNGSAIQSDNNNIKQQLVHTKYLLGQEGMTLQDKEIEKAEVEQYFPNLMYPKIKQNDFGRYKEFSVIHSDRSLNLMSEPFQHVMRDLNQLLKVTYNAHKVAIIPGSGTFGMESVARQYATNQHNVLVLRNGYFTYRWTQIFDMGSSSIPKSHTVLKAQPVTTIHSSNGTAANTTEKIQYAPHPIEQVVQTILQDRPSVVFAAHVETSTAIMLPDMYMQKVAEAIHTIGGLLVLDCIASGTYFIDMKQLGVDVLISAPQKDWTSPPGAALVMLSEQAYQRMNDIDETSFSLSLKQWCAIMEAYENGGYAYHTTPPTDMLRQFQEVSVEILQFGLSNAKRAQILLGRRAREVFDSRGLVSVAAHGFEAPGVLVYYSPPPEDIANSVMVELFHKEGLQIASGVPEWMIDEPKGVKTFRIGLFGLDKLNNVDSTMSTLEDALDDVLQKTARLTDSKDNKQ